MFWTLTRCPDRALDTHIYQAWKDPASRISFYQDACGQKRMIAEMEVAFGPVIVGEWSLATDNCAMWLNGFNDNLPGFPRSACKYIPCADPYMGTDQPGTPVDPSKPIQGPYGTGMSGPIFGLCPVDRDWLKESSGNPFTGRNWVRGTPDAPPHLDDTDDVMRNLAKKKIHAFSNIGHGFYFWNFRTELYEPQWSYMLALDRGWIPNYNLDDSKIGTACDQEDSGDYKCIVQKGQLEQNIHGALAYVLQYENRTDTVEGKVMLNLTGTALMDVANQVIGQFFDQYRTMGVTCDFGGIGQLVALNRTLSDDDKVQMTDDEYYGYIIVHQGMNVWVIALLVLVGTLVGSVVGLAVAMHLSKSINRRVRASVLFQPINKSKSRILRRSFALLDPSAYEDLDDTGGQGSSVGNGESTWLKTKT